MSNKVKSKICFIASLVTSVIIPLLVTVFRFGIIKYFAQQTIKIKISIIAAIIMLILLLVFFKRIIKYLNSFEYSYTVCFVKGVLKLLPLVCILLIFVNIIKVIDDLVFVTSWIVGCNIITFFVLDPLTAKYTLKHKHDIQRQLVKEAIDEK